MAETPSELQAEIAKLERKHAENPEGRYFVPLANAYRKLGQLPSAESLLREGLRWHPEYLSAHIVLGRCLAERGAADEAAEEFRYVLSLDPQNLIALRSLGEIALGAGRAGEAERWYRELVEADPMNEDARRALASLEGPPAAPRDDRIEDDGETEELPVLEEESPELVTETIAELYARQGLHDRSAEVYRQLIRRRGGDPALERRLAEVERLAAGLAPAPAPAPPAPEADAPAPEEPDAEPVDVFEPAEPLPAAPEPDAEAEEILAPAEPHAEPEDEEEWAAALLEPEPRAATGPTIAAFLAELAAWRPGAPAAEAEPFGGTGPAAELAPVAPAEAGPRQAEEEPAWESAPELERETLLSYEELLGGAAEPEAAPLPALEEPAEAAPRAAAAPAPAPAAEEEDDDDLESFQAWLRSLKR